MENDSAESVIAAIEQAFRDTTRGSGVSLHEACVIDDYGSDAERARARELDRETHWRDIPEDDIRQSHDALCFMDPAGWRYHIPAYMIWTIRHATEPGATADGTIYSFDLPIDEGPIKGLPASTKYERYQWPYILFRPFLDLLLRLVNYFHKKNPIDYAKLRESKRGLFSSLNEEQSRCVWRFLRLMVNAYDQHVDAPAAQRAMDVYWYQFRV